MKLDELPDLAFTGLLTRLPKAIWMPRRQSCRLRRAANCPPRRMKAGASAPTAFPIQARVVLDADHEACCEMD